MTVKIIGLAAAFLTTIAIVPQMLKAWRTRRVRDISIWQPLLLEAGMILWLAYGILIYDLPLIAANSFSILCNSFLIFMKIRFREDDNSPVDDYICEKSAVQEEP